MQTSCGWFFDELNRDRAVLVLCLRCPCHRARETFDTRSRTTSWRSSRPPAATAGRLAGAALYRRIMPADKRPPRKRCRRDGDAGWRSSDTRRTAGLRGAARASGPWGAGRPPTQRWSNDPRVRADGAVAAPAGDAGGPVCRVGETGLPLGHCSRSSASFLLHALGAGCWWPRAVPAMRSCDRSRPARRAEDVMLPRSWRCSSAGIGAGRGRRPREAARRRRRRSLPSSRSWSATARRCPGGLASPTYHACPRGAVETAAGGAGEKPSPSRSAEMAEVSLDWRTPRRCC